MTPTKPSSLLNSIDLGDEELVGFMDSEDGSFSDADKNPYDHNLDVELADTCLMRT